MSKTFAVFGATGQQGGSIVQYVLDDPELSRRYKVRAITRNVTSEKAKQLYGKAEVVQGDAADRPSLETALAGVDTVFIMTTPDFGPNPIEAEYNTAKRIADVAVEQGVQYIIFSTLPGATEISRGKYTKLTPFDAKAKAEKYIRSLPVKSAFYCPASFMENFQTQAFMGPKRVADGVWELSRPIPASSRWPLINAVEDGGKFVGAILAEPEKFEGKTFCAATALYTCEEMAAALSKSTGEKVLHKEVSAEEFKTSIVEPWGEMMLDAFQFYDEYKYFGPGAEESVAWAVQNARGGKLTTLDEFYERHPFRLGE